MAATALQEGDVFANRYRIVRELASGGMGAVYECVHTVTERRCALKVMLSHTVEREQLRKRFMQESRLAAQIGSEYIVDVLDAGVDDVNKAPYLVMELLEGEDLGQRLLRQGPLSRDETVSYLWHVALALDRTHQAGIVHRDLKASNLFLTRREDGAPLVKVLDFGIAKVLTANRTGEHRTQTVGTPIYMAPEQFRAEGRITPATDIYALGMLAYTLLVGSHYWTEEHAKCENPFAFANIAVHGPKDNPSERAARAGVAMPATFDGWFFRATNRWPQDRFPSATSAVSELARSLEVDAPIVPASVTLPVDPPASGARVTAGREVAQPRTIESPSGRVAAFRTGTQPSDVPAAGTAPNAGRENHTQVSLSVTSGEIPFSLGPPKPARSRFVVIGAAIGLVAAIVAAVVGVSLRAGKSHVIVRSGPAAYSSPSTAVAQAVSPSQAPAASAAESEEVKTIDELPMAPAEPTRIETLPHTVDEPTPHRSRASTASSRSKYRATAKLHEESSGGAVIPASAPKVAPKPAAPKVIDHDSLYGRD